MPGTPSSTATPRFDLAAQFDEFSLEANRRRFVGARVFPMVEVAEVAANAGKITIESLLKDSDTSRPPSGGYNRQDYEWDTWAYACVEHGAEELVDDRSRTAYRTYVDQDELAAQRAVSRVIRNYEKRVAAATFDPVAWTGAAYTTGITNEWDDTAAATPITDIAAAIERIFENSGLIANALVINWKVFKNLIRCDQIIDRIKYWGGDDPKSRAITPAVLANALDLQEVIVAGGVKDAAAGGLVASPTVIWSDEYAMVCRVAETDDPREPCIGRTFHWREDGSEFGDGAEFGGHIEAYRSDENRSDVVRCRMDTDELVMYVEAGHLLSNVTT